MLGECCNLQGCCLTFGKTMGIRTDVYACVVTGEGEGEEGKGRGGSEIACVVSRRTAERQQQGTNTDTHTHTADTREGRCKMGMQGLRKEEQDKAESEMHSKRDVRAVVVLRG